MKLLLHTPDTVSSLSQNYQRAFKNAIELFIVTAYLTEWDTSLKLNPKCCNFRVIIGKDFGITRKAACKDVMRWLPANRKYQFMVTELIKGFHPKAVFWKESNGECFSIVGSSNLTRAAFKTNYEANVFSQISSSEYTAAKLWVKSIEKLAVAVSEDWLVQYKEAVPTGGGTRPTKMVNKIGMPLVAIKLPNPVGAKKLINIRRKQLAEYVKNRVGLIDLFAQCAGKKITSAEFYKQLPNFWSGVIGDRLQGAGWEILGKHSDFIALSKSYLKIINATDEDRDDVIAEEIDMLHSARVPTRHAFLSEMLCLEFPEKYPVLNQPVLDYRKQLKFKAPQGASEGARYVDFAKKLRHSLLQNPGHPAKNLAELDTVIWSVFGKKKK